MDSFAKTQDRQAHIRNFAIIAHIDHGKSTLADRLLEMTGTVERRQMQEQLLDSNPIERERGITIKLAPVRMEYEDLRLDNRTWKLDKEVGNLKLEYPTANFQTQDLSSNFHHPASKFILNLIDTPGHVDFSYEVSRSLAACEGALLIVDATQGVQAQTLAHLHQARKHKLAIIPIINKIDLPNARIEACLEELSGLGFSKDEVLKISAKTGENVEKVLEAIVERIPPPRGEPDKPLRALVFSSHYDAHKGVVVFVRVADGQVGLGVEVRVTRRKGPVDAQPSSLGELLIVGKHGMRASTGGRGGAGPARLLFMASGAEVTPLEIGYFSPKMIPSDTLLTGEVGYIATGLKDARLAKVGDTITYGDVSGVKYQVSRKDKDMTHNTLTHDTLQPLPGYQEPKPMVFLGLFPINSDELSQAREAMERLRLSDSAFSFRPIHSLALGNGFHCGFLGLLHAEIVQERLLREFGLNMLATAPSVEYRVKLSGAYRGAPKSGAEALVAAHFMEASAKPLSARSLSPSANGVALSKNAHLPASALQQFISIQSASEFPDPALIEEVREPVMNVVIYSPKQYVGPIMQLSQEKRGELVDQTYLGDQVTLTYLLPLSEMIVDFFDRLKSITEGYASLNYEFSSYRPVEVVRLDILVNKEKVDALSLLVVANQAARRGRELVERLAQVIPRAQFQIPIQAAIGGQIIARADVKSFRKDVTQKLYGGDRTRKDKLLEAQKKGKARLKMIGKVAIPQSAFFEVLKRT